MMINSNHKSGIFISYAHVDNTPSVDGQKGWVDTLHEHLSLRLHQLLGEEVQIWRDHLLPPYEDYREVLVNQLREVTILVVILSPRYIRSEECLKELRQFCHPEFGAERGRADNQSRVIKLIKTPIDDNEPEELRRLNGYEFYEKHPDTGRPCEFNHIFEFYSYPKFVEKVYGYQKFVEKVYEVAWDIKRIIKPSSA